MSVVVVAIHSSYICSINNRYSNFALNSMNSITLLQVILNLLFCSSISSISNLMSVYFQLFGIHHGPQ